MTDMDRARLSLAIGKLVEASQNYGFAIGNQAFADAERYHRETEAAYQEVGQLIEPRPES